MENIKGNLFVQSLTPERGSDYHPSDEEKLVYFTSENGNLPIREYFQKFNEIYMQEMKNHSSDATQES